MVLIIAVLVLWALIGPIIALIIANKARQESRRWFGSPESGRDSPLEAEIAALSQRLAALEADFRKTRTERSAAAEVEVAPGLATVQPVESFATEASAVPPPGPFQNEPTPTADPGLPLEAEPDQGGLRTLEGQIGGRWSVLVGGLALALGAVFLVRYSIEQGLLGPGMRIALGCFLSAALLCAGEVVRRRDRTLNFPAFANADIPAVLTGAGALGAFATAYAAYALYGFLGDAAAFVLLTGIGLLTLALSVIHGPALAALGVLGSYAAPLLVSSAAPKPFPVVLHTLAVTAAVLALARLRGWLWLAITGVGASLAWGLLIGGIANVNSAAAQLVFLAGLTAIFVGALLAGTDPATLRDRDPNTIVVAALGGIAALSLHFSQANAPVFPPLLSGILLVGVLGAVASRWTSASPAVVIGAVLSVPTVMMLPAAAPDGMGSMHIGAVEWRVLGSENLSRFALKAAAVASVIGVGAFLSADRAASTAPRTAGTFAAAGASAPLLILAVVYLRHVPFETRPAVGVAALALAGAFAAAAERLIGRSPDPAAPAPALYAAGAVLALSFACAVGLARDFVPLSLALAAPGLVRIFRHRPVPVLPWLAVLCAAFACVAIVAGLPLQPDSIGTRRLLNGLVLRFGLPAAAVLLAGETLRRRQDGPAAGLLLAVGLALAALFVALEIRHFAQDGVFGTTAPGLGEQSAYTMAALAFALGLQGIASRTRSALYDRASIVIGGLGAAQIAIAHFLTANPIFTGEAVGSGWFFNLLLPGYLLPALLAAWLAAAGRRSRPRPYVVIMAALALLLGFAYLTLMVRRGFHGGELTGRPVYDAENWAYSAVWLGFGIALLLAGTWRRSVTLRAASGAVIAAVVCKVFLLDMAALTGALRAASFLGLGIVLIAIGRLYQRLMTASPRGPGDAAAPA